MCSTRVFMVPHLAGRARPLTILQLMGLFSRLDLCCKHIMLYTVFRFSRIIHFSLISYVVYTSRVPKLNTQHIHTRGTPSQNPMHRVSKRQAPLQALLLLRLDPWTLSLGLLPAFLLTCIFSVTCCPVPSSHLTPAANKNRHQTSACPTSKLKSLKISFPMSPIMNVCLSCSLLPPKQRKKGEPVTTTDLREKKKRKFRQKIQRG